MVIVVATDALVVGLTAVEAVRIDLAVFVVSQSTAFGFPESTGAGR